MLPSGCQSRNLIANSANEVIGHIINDPVKTNMRRVVQSGMPKVSYLAPIATSFLQNILAPLAAFQFTSEFLCNYNVQSGIQKVSYLAPLAASA